MNDTIDNDSPGPQPVSVGTDAPVENDSTAPNPVSGQQRFLTLCLLAAMIFLTGQWLWLSAKRPEPLQWHHGTSFTKFFRVDINHATWVEWIQLKGIGETMAHRIVADREYNGPFVSIDDLLRVDGIGPATLDEIRPWLTVGSGDSATQANNNTTRPRYISVLARRS